MRREKGREVEPFSKPNRLDCVVIANIDVLREDKQDAYNTFSSLKDGRHHVLFDNLKRYRYNIFRLANLMRKNRKVLDMQANVRRMLVGDQTRSWSLFDLINYIRAGRQKPVITLANRHEYVDAFSDHVMANRHEYVDAFSDHVTLNGVFLHQWLSRAGYSAELIQTFDHEPEDRFQAIFERKPRFAVVSATYIRPDYIYALKEITDTIKELSPDTRVIVGGAPLHETMKHFPEFKKIVTLLADYVISDPAGHQTLLRLISCLTEGGDPSRVPNLLYRQGGELVTTRKAAEACSINDVAIDWSAVPQSNPRCIRSAVTSQGCPFRCRFCNFRTRRLEYKQVEVLREELRSLERMGFKRLFFVDDLLTIPERRLVEILRMMLDEKFDLKWLCMSRASGLSASTISMMAEAGCRHVSVGMESADPTVLKNMDKRVNVDQAYRQVEHFRNNGITCTFSFVVGYPGETDASLERTLEFINTARPDSYSAYLFMVIRGTLVDSPEIRKQFQLSGESLAWKHYTGDVFEMAARLRTLADSVDDEIIHMDQAFGTFVLREDGYSREDIQELGRIISPLYRLGRKKAATPRDIQLSRSYLDRLEAFESAHKANRGQPRAPEARMTG
jgi:p-methyltransferase